MKKAPREDRSKKNFSQYRLHEARMPGISQVGQIYYWLDPELISGQAITPPAQMRLPYDGPTSLPSCNRRWRHQSDRDTREYRYYRGHQARFLNGSDCLLEVLA